MHEAAGDVERRRSLILSRLRLATFLPGAAAIVWMAARGFSMPVAVAAAVLLIAFVVLVVRHARIEERVAWCDALRLVNQRARARVERDWDKLPAATPPAGVDLTHHPYAFDLDLFGRASLAQWIGPSATPSGASLLSSWLLGPADPDEIRARQEAVAELAPAMVWREELAAHGVLASGTGTADLDRFFSWAEGPALFSTTNDSRQRHRLGAHALDLDAPGSPDRRGGLHGLLDDPAHCRARAVVWDGAARLRHVRPRRRRAAGAVAICRPLRAGGHGTGRHRTPARPTSTPRSRRSILARVHATSEPHPGVCRHATGGGQPAFRHPGVDAVGFPRGVCARPLARARRSLRPRTG